MGCLSGHFPSMERETTSNADRYAQRVVRSNSPAGQSCEMMPESIEFNGPCSSLNAQMPTFRRYLDQSVGHESKSTTCEGQTTPRMLTPSTAATSFGEPSPEQYGGRESSSSWGSPRVTAGNTGLQAGLQDGSPIAKAPPAVMPPEFPGAQVQLEKCRVCGRQFRQDRIVTHEQACTFGKKRPVFDSEKQRFREGRWWASLAAQTVPDSPPRSRKTTRATASGAAPPSSAATPSASSADHAARRRAASTSRLHPQSPERAGGARSPTEKRSSSNPGTSRRQPGAEHSHTKQSPNARQPPRGRQSPHVETIKPSRQSSHHETTKPSAKKGQRSHSQPSTVPLATAKVATRQAEKRDERHVNVGRSAAGTSVSGKSVAVRSGSKTRVSSTPGRAGETLTKDPISRAGKQAEGHVHENGASDKGHFSPQVPTQSAPGRGRVLKKDPCAAQQVQERCRESCGDSLEVSAQSLLQRVQHEAFAQDFNAKPRPEFSETSKLSPDSSSTIAYSGSRASPVLGNSDQWSTKPSPETVFFGVGQSAGTQPSPSGFSAKHSVVSPVESLSLTDDSHPGFKAEASENGWESDDVQTASSDSFACVGMTRLPVVPPLPGGSATPPLSARRADPDQLSRLASHERCLAMQDLGDSVLQSSLCSASVASEAPYRINGAEPMDKSVAFPSSRVDDMGQRCGREPDSKGESLYATNHGGSAGFSSPRQQAAIVTATSGDSDGRRLADQPHDAYEPCQTATNVQPTMDDSVGSLRFSELDKLGPMMEEVALLGAQVDELISRRQQFFRAATGDGDGEGLDDRFAVKQDTFASDVFTFGSRCGPQENGFTGFPAEQQPTSGQPARAYDPSRYCDSAAPSLGRRDVFDAWSADLLAAGSGSPIKEFAPPAFNGGCSVDDMLAHQSMRLQDRFRSCAQKVTERRQYATPLDRFQDGLTLVGEIA